MTYRPMYAHVAYTGNTLLPDGEHLEAKLSRQESISSLNEQWLDNEGNTIDEQHVIDTLESSSNYE